MNLRDALWVLDRAHTRDEPSPIGYVVEMCGIIGYEGGHSVQEYIEAWGAVRSYLRSTAAYEAERMEKALRGLRYAAQVNQKQDGLAASWAEVERLCKEGLGE